jgi:hypothetical protein
MRHVYVDLGLKNASWLVMSTSPAAMSMEMSSPGPFSSKVGSFVQAPGPDITSV